MTCEKCGHALDDEGFCCNCLAALVYRAQSLLRQELDWRDVSGNWGHPWAGKAGRWLRDADRVVEQAIRVSP